jgi:hypothetical protein
VATLETRTSPTGTSHRIKWRQDGTWQSETFGADHKSAARRFKHVELTGGCWPDGWIKGVGNVGAWTKGILGRCTGCGLVELRPTGERTRIARLWWECIDCTEWVTVPADGD